MPKHEPSGINALLNDILQLTDKLQSFHVAFMLTWTKGDERPATPTQPKEHHDLRT